LATRKGKCFSNNADSAYLIGVQVLGGSSALNFMVWDRATSVEYDAWEKLGNKGWNWKSMYHYMKKAEHYHAPSDRVASLFGIKPSASDYGRSGPIQVSFVYFRV